VSRARTERLEIGSAARTGNTHGARRRCWHPGSCPGLGAGGGHLLNSTTFRSLADTPLICGPLRPNPFCLGGQGGPLALRRRRAVGPSCALFSECKLAATRLQRWQLAQAGAQELLRPESACRGPSAGRPMPSADPRVYGVAEPALSVDSLAGVQAAGDLVPFIRRSRSAPLLPLQPEGPGARTAGGAFRNGQSARRITPALASYFHGAGGAWPSDRRPILAALAGPRRRPGERPKGGCHSRVNRLPPARTDQRNAKTRDTEQQLDRRHYQTKSAELRTSTGPLVTKAL